MVVVGLLTGLLVVAGACSGPQPSPEIPNVNKVTISGGDRTLVVGEFTTLAASVATSFGAPAGVNWSSSSPTVASVTAAGTVTALAPGETTLTATSVFDPAKFATATIRVVSADVPRDTAPAISFFTATPVAVAPGAPTELSWAVTGTATNITVREQGGAQVATGLPPSGSRTVTPAATATYELAVAWTGGTDVVGQAAVTVTAEDNHPPTARIVTTTSLSGFAPLTVGFDGGTSSDPDGDALTYAWDFREGSLAAQQQVTHSFTRPGNYFVTLTVTDGRGLSATASTEVDVGSFSAGELLADTISPSDAYDRQWIAVDSGTALVPIAGVPGATTFTRVDVYRAQAGSSAWRLEANLIPRDPPTDQLEVGRAVALSGTTAAIMSLSRKPVPGDEYESVIHIFERQPNGSWAETATLLRGMGIGPLLSWRADISMALRDDVLVVGITGEDGGFYGSRIQVYLPNQGGPGVWGLAQEIGLPASVPADFSEYFGTDVAVSRGGERIVVAKSMQNNDGGIGRLEAAFIFERVDQANSWILVASLDYLDLPSTLSTFVEIDGDTLAISSMPEIWSTETTVAVYERNQGGENAWGRVATRTVSIPEAPVNAGPLMGRSSMRLMGDTLAVGIAAFGCPPIDEGPYNCGPGRVYLFGRDVGGHNAWGEAQVLTALGSLGDVTFGSAVDISSDGRTVLVATAPSAYSGLAAKVFKYSR